MLHFLIWESKQYMMYNLRTIMSFIEFIYTKFKKNYFKSLFILFYFILWGAHSGRKLIKNKKPMRMKIHTYFEYKKKRKKVAGGI